VIAIDASALIKFLLKEEGWQRVADGLRDGALSIDLALKESSNAILKRLRRGEMSREEVDAALRALRTLVGRAMEVEGEGKYVDEAIEVAKEGEASVYDALYVVFSKAKGLTLMTADRAQARLASDKGVKVLLI
jgi:predicted nucleic acid-binding protein